MQIETIPLNRLHAHPANPNVMDKRMLAKLEEHIARTGWYEPLVVRPHPNEMGCYELLNGHHRKKVLEQFGHFEANCVIWQVSDDEALVLLATLNRLAGADDLHKRAQLMDQLRRRIDMADIAAQMPETRKQLDKLLALNSPPEPSKLYSPVDEPVPMTFFVMKAQRAIIERALKHIREQTTGDDPQGKMTRGDLLACLADGVLKNCLTG